MSEPPEQTDFNPFATPSVASTVEPESPGFDLSQYATVRSGLQFIYYSATSVILMMILVVIVFGMIAMYSISKGPGGNGPLQSTVSITMGISMLVLLGAAAASLIGLCLCVSCPNPNEKRLAITSVLCIVAHFGLSVFGAVFTGSDL